MLYAIWMVMLVVGGAVGQHNPSILEDARVHPTVDGSFGFLYRTQDGIAHAAKGDPGGAVHGRFTYTDPTGLKVNFNYNAGAQAVAAKKQQPQEPQYQAAAPRYTAAPAPVDYEEDYAQQDYEPRPRYRQPEPVQRPRYRAPVPAPQHYDPPPRRYDPPAPRYDAARFDDAPRYTKHRIPQHNDLYEYDYERV